MAFGLKSDVMLLDAITEIRKSVLSGHTNTIASLLFSLYRTLLTSRGNDRLPNFGTYKPVES